jgi:hypothetical protein
MRVYLTDGLRLNDYKKLKAYLDEHLESSPLGGIYWLKLDKQILTDIQKEHINCHPHVFALMLEETKLSSEFLIRIKKKVQCDCMAYATMKQRIWLMEQVDAIFEKLDIHF